MDQQFNPNKSLVLSQEETDAINIIARGLGLETERYVVVVTDNNGSTEIEIQISKE